MTDRTDVLIVGAGHAGAQTAIALRQGGFEGSIMLVGEEADPPYERPPLSKEYLAGEKAAERLLLRPLDFWAKRDVELRLSTRITKIDAHAHHAATEDGETLGYGQLVWAGGGYPRPLPIEGAGLDGVFMLRTRRDSDAIRERLGQASSIAVIGGGYVGLEAAAVLVSPGKRVTILEAQPRVLARVAGEPISRFFEDLHRSRGAEVRTRVGISAILGEGGRANAVLLGSGETIQADMVLVGIGLLANQAVLAEAGADCANGVVVDSFCRTSLPDIFAIGDCASHPSLFAAEDEKVRIESVQNASDQAKTAASVILGRAEPYTAVPWFWSNQYEAKLQTAGLNAGHDSTLLRGDPAEGKFSLIYLRSGRMIAIDCVNSVADFVAGKLLVAQRAGPDPSLLADPEVPLKSLLGAGDRRS